MHLCFPDIYVSSIWAQFESHLRGSNEGEQPEVMPCACLTGSDRKRQCPEVCSAHVGPFSPEVTMSRDRNRPCPALLFFPVLFFPILFSPYFFPRTFFSHTFFLVVVVQNVPLFSRIFPRIFFFVLFSRNFRPNSLKLLITKITLGQLLMFHL